MASSSTTDWSPKPPKWSPLHLSLLPTEIAKPEDISLATLIQKSNNFSLPFPIDTGRCKTLKNTVSEDVLTRNINSVYPILHENILFLYAEFILHKRQNGNSIEKAVYSKMDLVKFVDRLLTKRAAKFMGKQDLWMLMNGKKGSGNWESIGTEYEKPPLVLKDCLSYEEVKLSAFLSVSSYTYFVNIGDRKNFAVFNKDRSGIQDSGIIMGIIGPRMIKERVMDYQELVVTKEQNTKSNGYGKVTPPMIHHLFANFYDDDCLEYNEILSKKNKQRYTDLKKGEILDNFLYHRRVTFTMDTLFAEANARARAASTTAFVHVVGIGLGCWQKTPLQNKLFMDACGHRLRRLGRRLHNVSDVCFAYIKHHDCLGFKHGDVIPVEGHPLGGIKVLICEREPHARLIGEDKDKLLVVSYAWDGNALPGNEFWSKKLGSSGDSAAASSTQISELHNAFVNPRVCGGNLRVVSDGEVMEMGEFVEKVKRGEKRAKEDQ